MDTALSGVTVASMSSASDLEHYVTPLLSWRSLWLGAMHFTEREMQMSTLVLRLWQHRPLSQRSLKQCFSSKCRADGRHHVLAQCITVCNFERLELRRGVCRRLSVQILHQAVTFKAATPAHTVRTTQKLVMRMEFVGRKCSVLH